MLTKRCEFCDKNIITKFEVKRFCNAICQRKHYNRRPEIKERYKIRMREYRKNHPEWKEKHRIIAATKYRERRREYWEAYGKRAEFRERVRKKERLRRIEDSNFAIMGRLRKALRHAIRNYTNTGKIKKSREYGISWKEVIEHLKPFPEDIKKFEIDHIKPLHTFDLTKSEQVKEAFSPENLQWLTIEENRKKSGEWME